MTQISIAFNMIRYLPICYSNPLYIYLILCHISILAISECMISAMIPLTVSYTRGSSARSTWLGDDVVSTP